MRLWIPRSAARASLLSAMAAVCLVVSCLAVTMVGAVLLTQTPAVRDTLEHAPVRSSGVEVQAPVDRDRAAQDAALHQQVASLFPGLDMNVATRVDTSPLKLSAADAKKADAATVVLLQDDEQVRKAVRVTTGDWQGADGTVAIQEVAAKQLGLTLGQRVTIPSSNGDVTLTFVATWVPADPAGAIWFGDPRVVRGEANDAIGPFLVAREVMARFSTDPIVNWVITPAIDTPASAVATLASGFDRLPEALSDDPDVTSTPVLINGDGAQTAHSMQRAMESAASVIPLPVTILAVGAVLALILLARLLADVRAAETTLLRARGAATGVIVRATAVEAAAASLMGSAIGAGLAVLALQLFYGRMPGPLVALVPPALVVAAAVIVGASVAFSTARTALGAARDAGRARSAVSAGLTVVVVIAAGFTLWRFVGATAAGGQTDAAALLAPPLTLLAASLIGLSAFGPLSRIFDAVGARAHRFDVALPARQLGRGLGFFTAPAALVVLAVAAGVVGAGYQGTWTAFNNSSAIAVNGSDVRVDSASVSPLRSADDSVSAATYAALPTVSASVPAMRVPAVVGETHVAVIGVSAKRLETVEHQVADELDLAAIRKALPAPSVEGELTLPRGAEKLTVTSTGTGDLAESGNVVRVTLWLCDDGGELIPLPANGTGSVDVAIPPATGQWHIVGVDVAFDGGKGTWTLEKLVADGTEVPVAEIAGGGWPIALESHSAPTPTSALYLGQVNTDNGTVAALTDSIGVKSTVPLGGAAAIRLMPGTSQTPAVVVTQEFAAANGAQTGNKIKVEGDWWTTTATVSGAVPVIPGQSDPDTVLFDLPTIQRAALRVSTTPTGANQAWIATSEPGKVLPLAQRASGGSAIVTVADTVFAARFVSSAFVGLALGGIAVIALAVIALAAVAAALLRRRRNEVVVLRALGFSAKQQVRSRRAELWSISVAAGILGVIAGLAVTWLVVPSLARRTVANAPAALAAPIDIDRIWLTIAVVLAVVAAASVIAVYGRILRQQTADTEYREETR